MIIRVGTRGSPLALRQVDELKYLCPQVGFAVTRFITPGDRDKVTPLEGAADDFFTRDIDEALLSGRIDIAVHSAKDVPARLPDGLMVAFETPSISRLDAFVSRGRRRLDQCARGSRIGVSGPRRREAVRRLLPSVKTVDIRGTSAERIALVDAGVIDGLVVAFAALIRLRLELRAAQVFTLEQIPAHPKQGALAVVIRKEPCEKVLFLLSELGRAIRTS